jgi:hypothetical protein
LVCHLIGGQLAPCRTQKDYDFTSTSGRRIQVKYLANPAGKWRNEHLVSFGPDTDDYAIVFFENLDITAVVVFPKETLQAVCQLLCKRHANCDVTLQLTQANYHQLCRESERFAELGVKVLA